MSDRIRILIVLSLANSGGAQMAALRLARGLRDRGHDPQVLFLYERNAIDAPDHPYEVLLPTARPGIGGYARIARDLYRRIRQKRPDLVLTFLPLAHVLGQTAARLAGVDKRVVSHRTPVNTANPLLRHLDTLSAWSGNYTGVVAVSESVRATCRHYPAWLRDRTVTVHNGLHDLHPSALTRAEARRRFDVVDTFLLVAVGRLAEQKNYPLMLDIAERLDQATLLIAGDGPLRGELQTMIARRGLGEKIRLLGLVARSEIPDLLAAADVFIQTSTYEGQSNSVLEALQSSLPVIAHDIPEQRETIADSDGTVAGALVPLDDTNAWVAAIERLRSDPHAARTAREIATRRAQLFRYDKMITGFERAFAQEVTPRRHRPMRATKPP
jgi:glycosyltransferase involved in cell wall biosynthesis